MKTIRNPRSYTLRVKRRALRDYALSGKTRQTARQYGISPKTLRDWKANAEKIFSYKGQECRRMMPLGHNVKFKEIEDIVVARIQFLIECKMVMNYDYIYNWITKQGFPEFEDQTFKATRSWFDGVLLRNNLVPRAPTQLTKKENDEISEMVASHVVQVQRKSELYNDNEIVMGDETAVWPEPTTLKTIREKGTDTVAIFSGFNEKANFTVMCTVKKSGHKVKPLIVIPTTSASKIDTLEIYDDKLLGFTKKGWVTQKLLCKYLDYLFPFGRGLLIWDQASAHTGKDISAYYKHKNIEVLFVPAGCTGYVQVADVGLIRSFKSNLRHRIMSHYDSQVDKFAANPDMPKVLKKPGVKLIREWVVSEWNAIDSVTVSRALETCYFDSDDKNLHLAKLTSYSNLN